MSPRTRPVACLPRRHPRPGSLVSSLAASLLLSALLASSAGAATDAAPDDEDSPAAGAALSLSVSETADAVHLRIQASGNIEPGSLEVRFAGRRVVVVARDAEGRTVRSQRVRLPAAVVEDGASADYDADDALIMTLRKQSGTAAEPPTDPEALAR
jgi:HSP20 family molecular chaperone IbpA